VSPTLAGASGGSLITLTGRNLGFQNDIVAVTLASIPCTIVSQNDSFVRDGRFCLFFSESEN
jgi:hypothetical protein